MLINKSWRITIPRGNEPSGIKDFKNFVEQDLEKINCCSCGMIVLLRPWDILIFQDQLNGWVMHDLPLGTGLLAAHCFAFSNALFRSPSFIKLSNIFNSFLLFVFASLSIVWPSVSWRDMKVSGKPRVQRRKNYFL